MGGVEVMGGKGIVIPENNNKKRQLHSRRNPSSSRCFVVAGLDGSDLGLLLGDTLGKDDIVLGLLLLLCVETSALDRAEMTLALETLRSNQTLNFGTRKGTDSVYMADSQMFRSLTPWCKASRLPS